MSTPILEVRDLHVAYGKVEALHGVNLTVAPGQIVTVIGPNGAGKSTMLNAIAGALPQAGAARGHVALHGRAMTGLLQRQAPARPAQPRSARFS